MPDLPAHAGRFEIQPYQRLEETAELRLSHAAFTGAPCKHRHDPDKVVLVVDPCGSHPFYYEFLARDISHMEEVGHIVNLEGEVVTLVRLWVRKGSIAVSCQPFVVAELPR
ncbi:MAG: inorganic pyrophosphatase Ppa [Thermodesulfobacteriota bacterium]